MKVTIVRSSILFFIAVLAISGGAYSRTVCLAASDVTFCELQNCCSIEQHADHANPSLAVEASRCAECSTDITGGVALAPTEPNRTLIKSALAAMAWTHEDTIYVSSLAGNVLPIAADPPPTPFPLRGLVVIQV